MSPIEIAPAQVSQPWHPFSTRVQERVAETAEQMRNQPLAEVVAATGVDQIQRIALDGYAPLEVLRITPGDYDEHQAVVMHLPWGMGLQDPHIQRHFRWLGTALAGTGHQLVAFANPTRETAVTRADRRSIAKGELGVLFEPRFAYLGKLGIDRVINAGFSQGGAHATHASFEGVERGAHDIRGLIAVEMPNVIRRLLGVLAIRFARVHHGIDPLLLQKVAQESAEQPQDAGHFDYVATMVGWTPLALANYLSHDLFPAQVERILQSTGARITLAWGTSSELVPDKQMQRLVASWQQAYPDRIQAIRLHERKHSMGLDTPLMLAITLQGLVHAGLL